MRPTVALAFLLCFTHADAAHKSKGLAMPRLGVPILMQQEFRTNVVTVFLDKVDVRSTMKALHGAVSYAQPKPLTIDDNAPAHPVYFFDVTLPKPQVDVKGHPYKLVLTLFGVQGVKDPNLSVLGARGHEFLIVANAQKDLGPAGETLRKLLPEEKWPQVHEYVIGSGETYASAVQRIAEDIVRKTKN